MRACWCQRASPGRLAACYKAVRPSTPAPRPQRLCSHRVRRRASEATREAVAIIDAFVTAGDGAAGDGATGDGAAAAAASGAGEPPHAVEEDAATPVEALEAEAVAVASRLHAAAAVHGVCLTALLVTRGATGPMQLVWRCEEKAAADGSLMEELRVTPPSTARAVVAAAEAAAEAEVETEAGAEVETEVEAEVEAEAEAGGGAPSRGVALRLRLSPRAFFQTSTAGAEVLYGAVAARVEESGSGLPSLYPASAYPPHPTPASRHPVAPPPRGLRHPHSRPPAGSAVCTCTCARACARTPRPAHHAQVAELVARVGGGRGGPPRFPPLLLDVCCGGGAIGLWVAQAAAAVGISTRVLGIEANQAAAADAAANAAANGLDAAQYSVARGRAEDHIATLEQRPHLSSTKRADAGRSTCAARGARRQPGRSAQGAARP